MYDVVIQHLHTSPCAHHDSVTFEKMCALAIRSTQTLIQSLWETRLVSIWARLQVLSKPQGSVTLQMTNVLLWSSPSSRSRPPTWEECRHSVNMNNLADPCWTLFRWGESLRQKSILKCLSSFFFWNYSLPLLARMGLGLSAAFGQPLSEAKWL